MSYPAATNFLQKWDQSPLTNMAMVIRYSSFPVHHHESVAEHTFYVMMLAWAMARHMQEQDNRVCIDYGGLLERGLMHDLDESITGDIIRNFKHADPDLHFHMKRVSTECLTEAFQRIPGGGDFIMRSFHSSKDDSLEGRLIDFADVWSVYLYQKRELQLGSAFAHQHLCWVLERIKKHSWTAEILPYATALRTAITKEVRLA